MNMEREEKIKFVSRLITGTGVFAGLVAVLLLLNYVQLAKHDPIESAVIAALVERLDQDANNEALKEEIRQLDFLARKAYFTAAWQVKTGGFILLFAGIFLGILLKIFFDLKATIDEPPDQSSNDRQNRKKAVQWIGVIGGLVFIGALVSAFLSTDQLANYEEYKIAQA